MAATLAVVTLASCDRGSTGSAIARDSAAARATHTPATPSATAEQAAALAPPPPAALDAKMAAEERMAVARLPVGSGHDLVVANCLICHASTMIEQQHKDSAGWDKTVTQMIAWGAPVPAAQKPVLLAYLAAHYPAIAAGPPARQLP